MAKFQLCEYWRTGRKLNGPLKSQNSWEKGIAKVKEFDWDVEFILDEEGKKVDVDRFRLVKNLAYCAIDTECHG